MITASTTSCTSFDRGLALGTSGMADGVNRTTQLDYRITAKPRVSPLAGGHVWLRPAALDVFVPTTGHPAWSPPI